MKWKDLVFMEVVNYCNDIGSRTFSLKDFLDAKLQLFTKSKPQNQHVEAKIRQQLQFLRDEQKITFLDNSGHYTLRDIYLLDKEKEETQAIDLSKEHPEKREYLVETYVRNVKWAQKAVEVLGDFCLCAGCKNTFTRQDGTRYIEVHRLRSPSRRLRRVMVERLVRIYIIGCLAVPFHSQIQASASPVHHPVRVTPGLSSSSIRTYCSTI
jgi:hypothetical protein